jgi:hypothetical protein
MPGRPATLLLFEADAQRGGRMADSCTHLDQIHGAGEPGRQDRLHATKNVRAGE